MILVGIVVLVFLQDWRAMILPMIDVPVSLIGTFAVMAAPGLFPEQSDAVRAGAGHRHRGRRRHRGAGKRRTHDRHGLDARTATIKAMEEITGPILAITLALCSVFVPCCFLGGITGQFFRQFAVTIAASTIISAVNALTMTPRRAVLIFKTERGEPRSRAQARGVALVDLRRGGRDAGRTGTRPGYLAGRFGLPAASSGAGETGGSGWMSWAIAAALFHPRRGGRRSDRLAHHPAGECRAGVAVQGLQPSLRRGDSLGTVGRSASCCASAWSCCWSTGAWWC